MIVLLPDPALGGERRGSEEALEAVERVALGEGRRVDIGLGVAAPPGPAILRRLADQRADRDVAGNAPLHPQRQPARFGDPADHREIQLPFLEDAARLRLAAGVEDHQHAFLAFAEHDLEGGHAGFPHRHPVEIELDAEPALTGHLDRGRSQPGRPHILDGDDRILFHQLEAGLDQQFLGERVADLHGRPLLPGIGAEFGRGHRRAVNAVATGLGADIDDEVPRPGCGRIKDPVGSGEPDAHRVDQDVAVIGGVELALAADRRHADAIAVAADPGDDAGYEMAGPRVVGAAETQRVEERDRPRPHREHVAHYAADPGRRPLIGLDEGRVVMALDLEDDGVAVADIDDAGIFSRAANHPRPMVGNVLSQTFEDL